ncbi:MAG: hypothetical protein QW275_00150 [Candidatus Anstonellaceae archaeon]
MFRHKEAMKSGNKEAQIRKKPSIFYRKMLDFAIKNSGKFQNQKTDGFFDRLAEAEIQKAERIQNSRSWKLAENFSSTYMKFAEKKTKLLSKLGLDEQQLIEKIGTNRAFVIAKLGSKLDILNECASIIIGTGAGLFVAAVSAASVYIAVAQKDLQGAEQLFKTTIASVLKFALPAAIVLTPIFKALNWVGNTLDVLQHALMDSISKKLNSTEARKHYSNFCTESIREMMVDIPLSILPIPLIDLLRRVRAIKLELRQLGHISRLEKLYKSKQAEDTSSNSIPPGDNAQVQRSL